MTYERIDKRTIDQLRNTRITPNISPYAEGSALIEVGNTKVICTATVEDRVPPFLRNKGVGWVTAEYAMLPRATHTRTNRETMRPSGRTMEIQRLIGRSLRAVIDMPMLGERTIHLDCDVLQADGGTRTAAITGAFVAAQDAVKQAKVIGDRKQLDLKASETRISDWKVKLNTCSATDIQQVWTRVGSQMQLTASGGQKFCLDNANNTADGTHMIIYSCQASSNNNQNWDPI